jgi:hypothetical protein
MYWLMSSGDAVRCKYCKRIISLNRPFPEGRKPQNIRSSATTRAARVTTTSRKQNPSAKRSIPDKARQIESEAKE